MIKITRFYFYLLKMSIRASITKRGAFLIESSLMIANNLIFFTLWWIFFRQFNDIGGWKLQDMAAVMAIGTGAYGLNQICFGGVRYLSRMIIQGDLDPFMTQPKNILVHVVGSSSLSKGWGHLMTAFVLILLGGLTQLSTLALILTSILTGCLVFASINVIAFSMPFWFGSVDNISKKYCDMLFLFSIYPTNIYPGILQLVMFTLIPAGIIGYMPVELLRDFSWVKLSILITSSLLFVALAFIVFYAGLKRYESGNQFGIRS